MKRWLKQIILKLAERPYVQAAIADKADLSAFKGKPTPQILAGVSAIGLSYIICWPLISALGYLAYRTNNHWLLTVGGPVAYGMSHLVFILGMWLCGAKYSMIFLRWLTRVGMERALAWASESILPDSSERQIDPR